MSHVLAAGLPPSVTSHRNTASVFDAAEFPQNEEAGESDECEVAEGKAPAGYRPGYPPYGGQYAARAQGRSPASIAQAMLGAHDVIRVRVGLPPLVWSDQLARVAQDWANHLIATGSFSHRPNNRYGENVYSISGGTASRPGGRLLGRRGAGIRYSQQYLLRRLRPLHADRMGHDTSGGLRRRHRSASRGLGVQLRSARKYRRLPTILSRAFHWSRPSS